MARMNFTPVLTFVAIVVAVVMLVYASKNPNFKKMFSGLLQKLKGSTPTPTPSPTSVQQQVVPTPEVQGPGIDIPGGDFTGRSTGPGTRSQDAGTNAINRCVGVGVNPPDPQAYNDCVNAAFYGRGYKQRIYKIGIA